MVKNLKQKSIRGEELRRLSMVQSLKQNSMHSAELILNCRPGAELEQRRQENKTKEEFYAFYLKKEEWYPPQQGSLIDYHQDKEKKC